MITQEIKTESLEELKDVRIILENMGYSRAFRRELDSRYRYVHIWGNDTFTFSTYSFCDLYPEMRTTTYKVLNSPLYKVLQGA